LQKYKALVEPHLENTDTIKNVFTSFVNAECTDENQEVALPQELSAKNLYLFKGIPGNRVIETIEKELKMPMEDITLVLAIQVLQHLGYHQIRISDSKHNDSLSRHRNLPVLSIHESFNLDELCSRYFEYDPDAKKYPKFPYLISHQGKDLGLSDNGRQQLSPNTVSYAMRFSDNLNKSTIAK